MSTTTPEATGSFWSTGAPKKARQPAPSALAGRQHLKE
jgi:hypothetical protein